MKHLPYILYWFWLTLTGRERLARRLAYRHWAPLARAERLKTRHPVVCAWCKEPMRAGNPALPVSHGICTPCYQAVRASVQADHPLAYLPPDPPRRESRGVVRLFPAKSV